MNVLEKWFVVEDRLDEWADRKIGKKFMDGFLAGFTCGCVIVALMVWEITSR